MFREFVRGVVFGADDDSVLIGFEVKVKVWRLGLCKNLFADTREPFLQKVNGVIDGGIAFHFL